MIEASERARMLRAYSIGPRMIAYIEEAGITRLEDLAGVAAEQIAMRIDIVSGRPPLNRLGIQAIRNLIELANRECGPG